MMLHPAESCAAICISYNIKYKSTLELTQIHSVYNIQATGEMRISATAVLLLIGLSFSFGNGKSLEPVLSDNGNPCPVGINIATWQPDPCTHCICIDGKTKCEAQSCAPPPCNNYVVPVGECCPVCPPVEDDCESEFNSNWRPDPCTFCSCVNGKPLCSVRDCAAPSCSNFVIPPGQCCPVCPNGSEH